MLPVDYKPDIANTKQILQAAVPRETALDPCFRSNSALEPYASIEKLPSPKNVCCESLDPRTAAPSMCTSLADQGGYPARCELQYVVAASETPLIRDLLHQGVRRKDSVPRCSLNTTPV
ncbi:uncharacterized protein LOC120836337 [Ixodes scapularis]|uniref:uncharacterized protein LOC120836337 n=1 Tax=Ixodes scapularis TaxID=6945 RepID=UPI001A9EFA15|nr:uncharacterized protein LOC120836337 [Ixodes scapularis]